MELDSARSRPLIHPLVFTRKRLRGYLLEHVSTRISDKQPRPAAGPRGAQDPALQPARRIVIQYPRPAVDGGRYPAKRCVGDRIAVSADVFRDGHELIRASVRYRGPDDTEWQEVGLRPIDAHLGGVRWAAQFTVERPGRWQYTIEAWTDVFATWRDELQRKVNAGQENLTGELSEGLLLLQAAAQRSENPASRGLIEHAIEQCLTPRCPSAPSMMSRWATSWRRRSSASPSATARWPWTSP